MFRVSVIRVAARARGACSDRLLFDHTQPFHATYVFRRIPDIPPHFRRAPRLADVGLLCKEVKRAPKYRLSW